jgi:hypothetical protein
VGRRGANALRFASGEVGAKNLEVAAGCGNGFFGVVVRNEAGVVVEGKISLPTETVEDGQQGSVLFVQTRPNEINDGDVVSRLTPGAEAMTEHECERSFQHGFIRLLQAGFFVKCENFVGGCELAFGACEEAVDLRPVDAVRLELFHAGAQAERAYSARRFGGKHPCGQGGIGIPFESSPCS